MAKAGKNTPSGSTRSAASSSLNAVKSRPVKSQRSQSAPAKKTHSLHSENPQTCCSNCQTVFEVSLELLSTSDTRVRCGECLSIFDALANLRDLPEDIDGSLGPATNAHSETQSNTSKNNSAGSQQESSALPYTLDPAEVTRATAMGMGLDTAALDVTYSDFDLFSTDAALPDSHFLDYTRDTPELHFDDVLDTDETFSDTLFAQDVTVDARSTLRGDDALTDVPGQVDISSSVAFLTDDDQPEPLIFNYRDAEVRIPKDPVIEVESGDLDSGLRAPEKNSPDSVSQGRETEKVFDAKPMAPGSVPSVAKKGSRGDVKGEPKKQLPADFDGGLEEAESVTDEVTEVVTELGVEVAELETQPGTAFSATARSNSSPKNPWVLRGVLFSIVLVLALGLYAYRERNALLDSPIVRPLFVATCSIFSCEVPARVDIDNLRAVDRSVVSHPTVPDALIIKFGIVNQAAFSQPYPVLEIRLTDRAGRLVVTNRFLPSEYISQWQQGDVLDVGKRLDIGLAVEDPGKTAMSFELDFLKVK